MNQYYQNKRVLVTGGSSGIGLAIARKLAGLGASVWILARHPESLAAALAQLEAQRVAAQQVFGSITADVTHEKEINARIRELCASAGVPDILINCAGVAHPGCIDALDNEIFRWTMESNFFGTLYAIKAVIPGMMARKSGQIVNFASTMGMMAVYGNSAYVASKFAIRGLSSTLRDEMRFHGIHVSVIYPADTQTPQLEYEKPLEPPISRILTESKPITADHCAEVTLKGMARHRFAITPGFDGALYYTALMIVPWLEKTVMDFLVNQAAKKVKSA